MSVREFEPEDLEEMILFARLKAQEQDRTFTAYLLDLALTALANETE